MYIMQPMKHVMDNSSYNIILILYNSRVSAQLLADHYASTMARGTAPLDTFQQNVTKEVADYFAQCMRDPQHKQFSIEILT